MAEQRDATGGTVIKRFFGQGEQISGVNYYFTRDHLGSVREITDSAGTIHFRGDYDPYGRQTKIQGDLNPDFGFAGMFYHAISGFNLTLYRVYSADLGRWLNRDPIGERGGLNLYGFVRNDSVDRFDKLGLASWVWDAPNTVDYSISYDSSFTLKRHGAPTSYSYGTTAAELVADAEGLKDGLSGTLFDHYLHGGGSSVDLTSSATLKGEVSSALTSKMDDAENDIKKQVESFKCPASLNLFGNSISALGDTSFSPIDRVGFTSSIFVIKTADAGLSKQCDAIVICKCSGERDAFIISNFHMYFYDQFADAANIHHTPGVDVEWVGGTQFDETGAWGRIVSQVGVYR